jgi:hypothetical protein
MQRRAPVRRSKAGPLRALRRHMNVLHLQLGANIKRRLAEIDSEVLQLHTEGYAVDADRLLDERIDLAQERDELKHRVLS